MQDTEFDKFFITATSVADYEMFIDEHYDEELDDYTSAPTLKDTTWNLWDEYITNINNLYRLLEEEYQEKERNK